ncbi:CRISPR system precrRNA processing endoribonuclease RAMP protein Cas6 [Sphaerotilus sp.]|uniref:CRISPR system precrRNA processing endoribonuclease RAMP protein Cas6 n=1 Tax=Sphaerotilus sp. TaxID=2093942 RepID=UPI00286D9F55|nr:CRISPR system precrRNA processing endoribonuclease RAMP protein Cas6 [Sphaerotilus sp.]
MSVATLPIARYRFTARLAADLCLPDYAGSLLRGVFGAALRHTTCMTGLPVCAECPLWRSCSYPALFETPPQPTQFAQRFTQVPNPYVIEPPASGARDLLAGEPLVWHMVLIGEPTLGRLPLIVHAWERALRQGLGPQRVTGELLAVERIDSAGEVATAVDADTGPHAEATPARVTLHFHTPLRLQHQGQVLRPDQLDARTLLSQMLRRTNLVLDLHLGIRPAPFDASALLAAVVPTLTDDRSGLRWQDWTRYSGRQRQEMNLGGVVGAWTLTGALGPFVPWLRLGQWLHLGKSATMGLGGYQLEMHTA